MMDSEQQSYLLAVHRSLGLTARRLHKLQRSFGSNWKGIFTASEKELFAADMDKRGIDQFLDCRRKISPEKEFTQFKKCGAQILLLGEENFPLSLQQISSPPAILFLRGNILSQDFPCISVVGSRNISSYGKRVLEKIVSEIATAGITIVSGLALGADTLAHKIAVERGARTICVLGNGIDHIYPAGNEQFAEKLLNEKKGVLLSEYLPGVKPRPEYFPVRNRLIAGISKATIIIEAAEKSGSLITAQMAVEQGRDVFAVPGDIFAKNSIGTNQLILSSGVYPALSGQQILEHLGLEKLALKKKTTQMIPSAGIEAEIIGLFGTESRVHINDLIRKSSHPGSVISANISLMEMKGLVRNLGNQIYSKNV